jgi:hypothetical protein
VFGDGTAFGAVTGADEIAFGFAATGGIAGATYGAAGGDVPDGYAGDLGGTDEQRPESRPSRCGGTKRGPTKMASQISPTQAKLLRKAFRRNEEVGPEYQNAAQDFALMLAGRIRRTTSLLNGLTVASLAITVGTLVSGSSQDAGKRLTLAIICAVLFVASLALQLNVRLLWRGAQRYL